VHCSSYQDQDPLGEIADSVAEFGEGVREGKVRVEVSRVWKGSGGTGNLC